jgi:hypothetical protein
MHLSLVTLDLQGLNRGKFASPTQIYQLLYNLLASFLMLSHEKPGKNDLTETSYAIALRNNVARPDDAVDHLLDRHLNG